MAEKKEGPGMRTLVVHFVGGTEISLQTVTDPSVVHAALADDEPWLVVEDAAGERHYLAKQAVAYLTFSARKGVGFRL